MSRSPYICLNVHCTHPVRETYSWCDDCLDRLERRWHPDLVVQAVQQPETARPAENNAGDDVRKEEEAIDGDGGRVEQASPMK